MTHKTSCAQQEGACTAGFSDHNTSFTPGLTTTTAVATAETVDEISSFLAHFGLRKYEAALRDVGLENLADMKDLTAKELNEVAKEAKLFTLHRKKFVKAAKSLFTGKHTIREEAKEPEMRYFMCTLCFCRRTNNILSKQNKTHNKYNITQIINQDTIQPQKFSRIQKDQFLNRKLTKWLV